MRTDLESRLRERQSEAGDLFPDYESYRFGNVADTVRSILGVGVDRPSPETKAGADVAYEPHRELSVRYGFDRDGLELRDARRTPPRRDVCPVRGGQTRGASWLL